VAINPQTGNRIGHEELRRRLTGLNKVKPTADDEEHVKRLKAESDRGVMILAATMLDDALIVALGRTMPGANSKLKSEIFSNHGPLSTFSARITFAEALGLVSPIFARQMNIIRQRRNVAAHAHAAVDFSLEEVKQVLATMLDDKEGDDFETWSQARVRNFYLQLCGYVTDRLIGGAGGLEAAATSPDAIFGLYRALKASDLEAS